MQAALQILALVTAAALAPGGLGGCRGASAPAQAATAAPAPATTPTSVPPPVDQDRYRRPDDLVAALHFAPGATVADVGAGGGYLTHRLAARAGTRGRVVATDVDGDALGRIGAPAAGEAPIETRRVAPDQPGLEAGAYNLILLSEVDHLLGDRAAYFTKLAHALAPGGRIAIINRRVHRAAALAAAERAGLTTASEYTQLPTDFLVEVKP